MLKGSQDINKSSMGCWENTFEVDIPGRFHYGIHSVLPETYSPTYWIQVYTYNAVLLFLLIHTYVGGRKTAKCTSTLGTHPCPPPHGQRARGSLFLSNMKGQISK